VLKWSVVALRGKGGWKSSAIFGFSAKQFGIFDEHVQLERVVST
jgi:hypothetical protein